MLSQSVGYAATALGIVAASEGKPLLTGEIAKRGSIPAAYLRKLINVLARRGIVKTRRGIGGGVELAGSPAEFTLYDVSIALDDPIVKQRCMLGNAECSDERACPCHRFWVAERKKQIDFLKRTTLLDMACFEKRKIIKNQLK